MTKQTTYSKSHKFKTHIELIIMTFIFLVLFLLPVLFTRVQDEISWLHVFKIWKDYSLLIPIFIFNHWLLIPKQLNKQKYFTYFLSIVVIIAIAVFSYYYIDEIINARPPETMADVNHPTSVPPYAELVMYSILIVGVDAGLFFSKNWLKTEEKKHLLEKKNSDLQLEILRNQVSPHFFMNTLNNIYALIEIDTPKAREAVMKLSKLMRYMLYENENGTVKLSKEFEFIRSYIDLMKLRFADESVISLNSPEKYNDVQIPALLFISYIENAFKYRIQISFNIVDNMLFFSCENIKQSLVITTEKSILDIENNIKHLDRLYGERYSLTINSPEKYFDVTLKIPLT